jgi:hypothetical protein
MDIRRDPEHLVHYVEVLVGTNNERFNLYLTTDNNEFSLVSNQCSTCNVPNKYDY